jgi:hypothetical protein
MTEIEDEDEDDWGNDCPEGAPRTQPGFQPQETSTRATRPEGAPENAGHTLECIEDETVFRCGNAFCNEPPYTVLRCLK